jgi:hypothetical protein
MQFDKPALVETFRAVEKVAQDGRLGLGSRQPPPR